jgi:hypothetical protein
MKSDFGTGQEAVFLYEFLALPHIARALIRDASKESALGYNPANSGLTFCERDRHEHQYSAAQGSYAAQPC